MTHPHQMTDPAAVREFTFAGDARLTLVSKKTGARFTYRVRKADGDGPVSHFVSVLTGPENSTDYSYLGFFRKGGGYEHGRKSTIGEDAPSAHAFKWFAARVLVPASPSIPDALECWTEGRCGRCARVLTDPTSIARGLGPECAGRL